jgi:class 3 adenylate cyclase
MEAPHLERKLVAILAADIEGFSTHMERDEAGTLAVLSSHRLIIDASIAEFGGRSRRPLSRVPFAMRRRWRGMSRARKPPKLSEMTCPEATSSTCVRRRCVPSRQLNRSGPKTSKQLG